MSNKTAGSARSRARTLLLSGARLLFAALAGSLLAACAQGADEPAVEVSTATEAIQLFAGIQQRGNVLGDAAAPVTLVEFSDLRCSHCRDFAKVTLPVIIERYVRTGKVRVIFGNLPILGPASVQAARMAAAVGLQGHLFEFVGAFFQDASGPIGDDLLGRIAAEVPGVDVPRALADRNSAAVTAALTEMRMMANQYAIDGTPAVLLGKTGATLQLVPGARAKQPETVTGPIDALLAQP